MAKKKNQVKKLPTVEHQTTQNPVDTGTTEEKTKVENQDNLDTTTPTPTETPKNTPTKKERGKIKIMTVNQVKKLPTEKIREIEKLQEKGEVKVVNTLEEVEK